MATFGSIILVIPFIVILYLIGKEWKRGQLRDCFEERSKTNLDWLSLEVGFERVLTELKLLEDQLEDFQGDADEEEDLFYQYYETTRELAFLREIEEEFGLEGAEEEALSRLEPPDPNPYTFDPHHRAAPSVKHKGPASARQ